MFYLNSTLNFGIPPVLVFQLEDYYKVDRLLIGLTAQQKNLPNRLPCFCYEGLPLVAFWRFYCINLVFELISPLIDNTVQQATHLFIILLKTKKLKIVEDDIFNALVQTPTRVQRP